LPIEESSAAIVLRARDYSESDRIVTLLTREFGKLSGIAKGAKASRRRFENKLELFSLVTLFFRRRPQGQLVFITRAERSEDAPPRLDDDLGKIALGSYMLELADALTTEEAEAAAAYQVLCDALGALGQAGATSALRAAYELKMLEATGFGLDFSRCRICEAATGSRNEAVYFISSRGGVVCTRCRAQVPETAIRLSADSATTLTRLQVASFDRIPAPAHSGGDAALAIARFLTSILDRRLRSVEFLDSLV
jgi:DNA repair protein RecO (recombination protein O)